MGREATLNYPGIDNQFQNDSASGVLIRACYSRHVDHGRVLRQQGGADGAAPRARTSSRRSRSRRSTSTTRRCPRASSSRSRPRPATPATSSRTSASSARPASPTSARRYVERYAMRPTEDLPRAPAATPTTTPAAPPHRLRPAEHAYAPAVVRAVRLTARGTEVPARRRTPSRSTRGLVDADGPGLLVIDVVDFTDAELDLARRRSSDPPARDRGPPPREPADEARALRRPLPRRGARLLHSSSASSSSSEVDVVFGEDWLLVGPPAGRRASATMPFDVDLAQRRFDAGRRESTPTTSRLPLWALARRDRRRLLRHHRPSSTSASTTSRRSSSATSTRRDPAGRSSTSAASSCTSGARSCRCAR